MSGLPVGPTRSDRDAAGVHSNSQATRGIYISAARSYFTQSGQFTYKLESHVS